MPFTHDELELIGARFVSREECCAARQKQTEKISDGSARLSVIESQLKTIARLMWIIATSAVGGIVTAIFTMIIK